MDAIEVKVNVNQRRQTRWLKDYQEDKQILHLQLWNIKTEK